jgi:hypothetical protein
MSTKAARLFLALAAAAMLLPALPAASIADPPAYGGGACGADCNCPPHHSDPRCFDSYPYNGFYSDDPFDDEIGVERRHHFDFHDRMHDHDPRGPDGGTAYDHHGGLGGRPGGMSAVPYMPDGEGHHGR